MENYKGIMDESPESKEENHIIIDRYCEEHQQAVLDLILPIQIEEFGINVSIADQPDLENIPEFYQRDGGEFWLATAGEKIVGSVGLLDIGNNIGAIRKMFVDAAFRGKERGIAINLISTLKKHAQDNGFKALYLGTTEAFKAAHRFYEREGFEEISVSELPDSFERMSVDSKFYKLDLNNLEATEHLERMISGLAVIIDKWAQTKARFKYDEEHPLDRLISMIVFLRPNKEDALAFSMVQELLLPHIHSFVDDIWEDNQHEIPDSIIFKDYLSWTSEENFSPDHFDENDFAALMQNQIMDARIAYLIIKHIYGKENAKSMFLCELRKSVIAAMVQYNLMIPQFIISLDANERKYLEQKKEEFDKATSSESKAELNEFITNVLSDSQKIFRREIKKTMLDVHPQIVERKIEVDNEQLANRSKAMLESLTTELDERRKYFERFLADPQNIDNLYRFLLKGE